MKPLRQKQEWLPIVLTHLANSLHSCCPVSHSFTSRRMIQEWGGREKEREITRIKLRINSYLEVTYNKFLGLVTEIKICQNFRKRGSLIITVLSCQVEMFGMNYHLLFSKTYSRC